MCVTDLQSSCAAMETTAGMVTAGNDLFQSVQLKSETTWYESCSFFSLDLSVGHFECFFFTDVVDFKATNLYPFGLIISKIMLHPFGTHSRF